MGQIYYGFACSDPSYWIVSVTCWEWLTPPLVPVTVSVDVPVGAFRLALIVSVDEPEFVIDAGMKLELVRRGSPVTLSATVPENPAPGVIVTVYCGEEPRPTLALVGVTEIE